MAWLNLKRQIQSQTIEVKSKAHGIRGEITRAREDTAREARKKGAGNLKAIHLAGENRG
jgi:hypothetical protein